MRVLLRTSLLAAALLLGSHATAAAQARVFIDCSFFCDMDFLRTELNWVDYVRDRADADVHVLVTRQGTGGGGSEYTLEFIGLRDMAGRADTLRWIATSDDTSDLIRRGLTRTIKIGLVPFVAATPIGRRLDVTLIQAPTAQTQSAEPQSDPWNFWTFTVGVNGFSNGESQQQFTQLSNTVTANRTTEAWKVNIRLNGNYGESSFEYVANETLVKTKSVSRGYSMNTLLVRSISPHLSVGGRVVASTSTFNNNELTFTLTPAVEYNFVPYSESTRRSLTLQYAGGVRHADYREVTIFDRMQETRPLHTLALGYSTRQPWGSISLGLDGSQYLHDTGKYSAGLGGSTSLRLFRGFSFNVGGNYRRVHDQLSLPRRNLSESEVLLRQRQLATNYSYFVSFGVSYRFGSIFNNVVNPRFGSSGETIIMM